MTTTTQDSALVLKNEAGDYFVLPQEMLERGRVPAERTVEVERLVAETKAAEQDDTRGHIWILAAAMNLAAATALVIGYSDRFGIGSSLDGPLPSGDDHHRD